MPRLRSVRRPHGALPMSGSPNTPPYKALADVWQFYGAESASAAAQRELRRARPSQNCEQATCHFREAKCYTNAQADSPPRYELVCPFVWCSGLCLVVPGLTPVYALQRRRCRPLDKNPIHAIWRLHRQQTPRHRLRAYSCRTSCCRSSTRRRSRHLPRPLRSWGRRGATPRQRVAGRSAPTPRRPRLHRSLQRIPSHHQRPRARASPSTSISSCRRGCRRS